MILFTETIARPAIWGGTLIRDYFDYPQFPGGIGQSWSFSAQEGEGKSNRILSAPYEGMTLRELWEEHPELFHSRFDRFPVIISLVAPEDDLSLQIHPNDRIAAALGYPSGKNEAWYFLRAEEGSSIVYGQSARNEEELRNMIRQDRWEELMCLLPVREGDFVYLPAGIVHALKKGNIVYEIQQATDITYRFYDYHRKDSAGQERPLQLEEAIACVDYSLDQSSARGKTVRETLPGCEITTFIRNESFCVRRFLTDGSTELHFDGYRLMTCVRGAGKADGIRFHIGESFLVPAGSTVRLEGVFTLMCTSED